MNTVSVNITLFLGQLRPPKQTLKERKCLDWVSNRDRWLLNQTPYRLRYMAWVSAEGEKSISIKRKCKDWESNPGPLALVTQIPAALFAQGVSGRSRNDLNQRKCPDQLSSPGLLALKADTIPAALYDLDISRGEESIYMKGNARTKYQTRDLWLLSQTPYWLHYMAWVSAEGKTSISMKGSA